MWPVAFDEVGFDEAVAWFRDRVAVDDVAWGELSTAARARAFRVAGVAQLDLVAEVWRALEEAIASGTTLDDFKAHVGEALRARWGGSVADPSARIETIFRTNVQLAYGGGRYAQATDPDVLAARPFWLFDAVMDGRTTVVCEACDGTILPADDPFWRTHVPPLHHRCRSTLQTLTEEEAHGRGIATKAPEVPPASGFGAPPRQHTWEPSSEDYPDELWALFLAQT